MIKHRRLTNHPEIDQYERPTPYARILLWWLTTALILGAIAALLSPAAHASGVVGAVPLYQYNGANNAGVATGEAESDSSTRTRICGLKDVDCGEAELPCIKTSQGTYDCTMDTGLKEEWSRIQGRDARGQQVGSAFRATVTSYTARVEETDASPEIAADGTNIVELWKKGITTCASRLPFGTRLRIEGLGECVVHDRMSVRFPLRTDWFSGPADQLMVARRIGKRERVIEILP